MLKIGGLGFNEAPKRLRRKRLFLGYNRTLAIGILPVSTFCSGHTYFVTRMPQKYGIEPYSVHTTFQYSGAVGKTHRLREAMLWEEEDPREYYDPSGGLLQYTPKIRWELIRPEGLMGVESPTAPISPICRTPLFPYLTFYSCFSDVELHFRLMNAQLVELRAAFLLAAR